MHLNNCIPANMLEIAIHPCKYTLKGLLSCKKQGVFQWLTEYISVIEYLYDIVSRAVKAQSPDTMPTARTNKQKIKYSGIRFFVAVAIAGKKSNSAVHILLCKFFKHIIPSRGEVMSIE